MSRQFGGLVAVDEVDLKVKQGMILGIIGPNGAGKTTIFNLITGYLKPTSGRIFFKSQRIDGMEPNHIVKKGLARTFQIVRPFPELSVLENVLVGRGHLYYGRGRNLLGRYKNDRNEALRILEFVGLEKWQNELAKTLPIGLQRRLEIARALALNPTLLLLDEPAAGLTEEEVASLTDLINRIMEDEVTIVLVEHTMSFVMNLCEHLIVLDRGKVIARGSPDEIKVNPQVIEAYLGSKGEKNTESDHEKPTKGE